LTLSLILLLVILYPSTSTASHGSAPSEVPVIFVVLLAFDVTHPGLIADNLRERSRVPSKRRPLPSRTT
jgi:hypothetical protein